MIDPRRIAEAAARGVVEEGLDYAAAKRKAARQLGGGPRTPLPSNEAVEDAVRDYLVNTGGLSADKVRAVSYGEATNRQVEKGQIRDAGASNRRVTLVVDFAGGANTGATAPTS